MLTEKVHDFFSLRLDSWIFASLIYWRLLCVSLLGLIKELVGDEMYPSFMSVTSEPITTPSVIYMYIN